MTLVVNRVKDKVQMHALVIGVGAYPHLMDGSEVATAPAKNSFGLEQLSSPPVSAQELADWLISKYRNAKTPLGSLDLLIANKDGAVTYKKPTGREIRNIDIPIKSTLDTAIKAWKARADRNEDNIAFFFFCGHGLSTRAELSLLASDFGNPAENEFENAIDLNAIIEGMELCKANYQTFFIDACRNEPRVLLDHAVLGDDRILERRQSLPGGKAPKQAIYYAAARDGKAHSLEGQASRFTKALLCGLNGAGSQRPGEKWVVNTLSLANSIGATLELGNRVKDTPWQDFNAGKIGRFDLHRPREPFQVPVAVTCHPEETRGLGELIVTPPDGEPRDALPAEDVLWLFELEVKEGTYEFKVHFAQGAFPDCKEVYDVGPDHRDIPIKVQR